MLNLKELRKRRGLTQQEVADALGIDRALYARYENGSRTPPLENLSNLADFFGVTLDCVAGRSPVPEGYPDSYFTPARVADLKRPEPREETPKNAPFSDEQIEYLNGFKDQIVEEVVEALREDTSSLKETN